MDPLSIVTTSFALAGSIAKTGMTLTKFASDFRGCGDDLGKISTELQAIAAILDPLTRTLSRSLKGGLPEGLFEQVDNTLTGCVAAVEQVEGHIEKYRHDKAWTKAKWVLFGQEDMTKLRESLEVYKMALSVGLQAISLNIGQDIKDDTEILRSRVEAVKLNTDEILARIESIREMGPSFQSNAKVNEWIEGMAILSTYAESTYKETIIDPAEFARPPSRLDAEGVAFTLQDIELGSVHNIPRKGLPSSKVSRQVASSSRTTESDADWADDTSTFINKKEDLIGMTTISNPIDEEDLIDLTTIIQPTLEERREWEAQTYRAERAERAEQAERIERAERAAKHAVRALPISTPAAFHPRDIYTKNNHDAQSYIRPHKTIPSNNQLNRSFSNPPYPLDQFPPRSHSRNRLGERLITPKADISFAGVEEHAKEIKIVASKVRLDSALINNSRALQSSLDKEAIRGLREKLTWIDQYTPEAFVLNTIAEGADTIHYGDHGFPCEAIAQALLVGNQDCLFALLRCGADPNTRVKVEHSSDDTDAEVPYVTALAFAAWTCNQIAVWALVAAGANINPPDYALNCPQCRPTGRWICTTPLMTAIDGSYLANAATKISIIRFLLANDADPNYLGCKLAGEGHDLHSPLSVSMASDENNDTMSVVIAGILFKAGATFDLRRLPMNQGFMDINNPFHHAAMTQAHELLTFLAGHLKPSDSMYWKRAISCAAISGAWTCMDILMNEPYAQTDYLHYLVHDYMKLRTASELKVGEFGWDQFSKAARILLERGSNPSVRASFTYKKKKYLSEGREVTEDISVFALVEKVATWKSRSQVRRLLEGKH